MASEERKQPSGTPTQDSTKASICACLTARKTARAVTNLYDLVLAPTKLKATQFIALRAIRDHGEVSQTKLARENCLAPETLSRRLSGLVKAGWVAVRIGGAKREHFYSLTPAGLAKVIEAAPYWERAQYRISECLRAEDLDLLDANRVLNSVASAAVGGASLRVNNKSDKPGA